MNPSTLPDAPATSPPAAPASWEPAGSLNSFDWPQWSAHRLAQIEAALHAWIDPQAPAGLGQAMRYAVLDGGKRLRPLLVLATCEAVQGQFHVALKAACAVELIHAYSLVHDDMPCMDNDVWRRGKPTVHVRHGEAMALLAGDALQALAFEWLSAEDEQIEPRIQARLCGLLARASGYLGMAGGQAIDLSSVGQVLNEAQLRHMHMAKTGALLRGCVLMGACCGPTSPPTQAALTRYGDSLGLAYQIVDDILDVEGSSSTLGKTAGKDAEQGKPTYVSIMGMASAKQEVARLHQQALKALTESGLQNTKALQALSNWVIQRAC